MKFIEKLMLNTHYQMPVHKKLTHQDPHLYTFTPEVVRRLIYTEKVMYRAHGGWLVELREAGYMQYVYLRDLRLLEVDQLDWFKNHWASYLVVFNPIYTDDDGGMTVYSNYLRTVIPIDKSEDLLDVLLEHGAYSIGNGITLALSLVALGKLKEAVYLESISELFIRNSYLSDLVKPDYIIPYFHNNRCQICNHHFKYAYVYNSERIYKYMYGICREDMFLYHVSAGNPKHYVSTIFNMAVRKDQYDFARPFKYLYNYFPHNSVGIYPNLCHLFFCKDFDLIGRILNITECDFSFVLFTLSYYYGKDKSRHWINLWRYLMRAYWDAWGCNVFAYLNKRIQRNALPKIPYKMMRDMYHHPLFVYTDLWKNVLKASGGQYMRYFDRKAIHRLKLLEHMVKDHPEGHVVKDLMRELYLREPDLLCV
jgi:hypothetical protein